MARTPAWVAGTLTRTLSRSRRRHRSSAWTIVPSASSARSGVHSNEMKPSPPSVRAWTGRRIAAALRTSSSATAKKQLPEIVDAGRDQRAQLVVVAVRAGDRLGEDRRVRGRSGHRVVADQPAELPRSPAARARAWPAIPSPGRRAGARGSGWGLLALAAHGLGQRLERRIG